MRSADSSGGLGVRVRSRTRRVAQRAPQHILFPIAALPTARFARSKGERAQLSPEKLMAVEREIRLYYDQLLGGYVNVGFRLCEGDEEPELRRCLIMKRDYDIFVLAYEGYRCQFGGRTIEEFAEAMPCPTVLVGPERSDQFFLNSACELYLEELGLSSRPWHRLIGVVVMPGEAGSTSAA